MHAWFAGGDEAKANEFRPTKPGKHSQYFVSVYVSKRPVGGGRVTTEKIQTSAAFSRIGVAPHAGGRRYDLYCRETIAWGHFIMTAYENRFAVK